ncbi:uncharacterized protein LOC122306189 [Carya illinoinensis]|uniref:uncharacterized protein LOC122306189 n=1 Tax=Carya illinoinensis TaxID=32201 RepID=UPI001C72363A|nr:uncharacterized protein LOC122306189 [Carya illinoinensis]
MHGSLLLAFSVNLGYGSSTCAELMALLEGVMHCKRMHFHSVNIEIDSRVILSWWQHYRCGIWYLEDYWEELQALLLQMNFTTSHIFREGDVAADWLARFGARYFIANLSVLLLFVCFWV